MRAEANVNSVNDSVNGRRVSSLPLLFSDDPTFFSARSSFRIYLVCLLSVLTRSSIVCYRLRGSNQL
jgi:hypothetical protein